MRRGAARLRAAEAAVSVAEACCRGASVERGRGCAWCGRGIRSASACLRWRRVRMPKRRRLPCWWRGACGVCRRLSRGASSTPSRRRWRRLSPRRCRPRRPRGRRPPPTPRPTARAPTPPPRPPRRAGRPCRSGRGAAALGERARGAARRVALAEVVAPPVALRRRRAPPTRATGRAVARSSRATRRGHGGHSCQDEGAARVQGRRLPRAARVPAARRPRRSRHLQGASPSHWERRPRPLGRRDAASGRARKFHWTLRDSQWNSHWKCPEGEWGLSKCASIRQWEHGGAPRPAEGGASARRGDLAGSHSPARVGGAPLPCARHFLWGTFLGAQVEGCKYSQ